ncbi:MAG: hypothetical protein IT444_07570 [Phycisphaeraceae bacterium]|nr:hypothetical protein [Phycisphaeraceae bacterium]
MNTMIHPILARLTLDNADPAWFWLLVVVASVLILALTYHGIYQRSGRKLTWCLFILRLAGVLALLVSLLKPSWTVILSRTDRPRLAVVLDDSQSMSLPQRAGDDGAFTSRYQAAKAWLSDSSAGKLLRERFDVSCFAVDGRELNFDDLPTEPTSEQTDLLRGVRAAAGKLRGQSAAGIIVISDGRDTTGRDDYLAGQDFILPTYAIGFRQPTPGKGTPYDLSVVSVDAPQRTLVHNAVQIKALVGKDGGDAVNVPIQIERAGKPLMTQHVALPAGAIQQMVTLSYTPTEPGDFVLSVHALEQSRERTTANNTRIFKLRVDADPIRVLYIEGYLRPEYTFLRDRLGNDPDINLATLIRSANPDQMGASGLSSVIAGGDLINQERLQKIDVVVLGDFEASMLSDSVYTQIRKWVEGGGALMVLGGYHSLSDDGLARTPLAEALPVELVTGPLGQVEDSFTLKLTDDGKRHPAMIVTGDASDVQRWESLPSLKGLVRVSKAKPGATVLIRAVPSGDSSTPVIARGDEPIVLAWQRFGKGPVAVLTADTTWRWSRIARLAGKPDTMYVRFWSQMIRWLAGRDINQERTPLAVSTDAAVYQRGQRVTVRVKRNPAAMVPTPDGQAAATTLLLNVRSPDGRSTALTPIASADPDTWTATYFPDRGGRFEVDARLVTASSSAAQDLPERANQVAEFLVHGSGLELDDPSTNPALLEKLVRPTGGYYTDIDDQEGLTRLVENLPSEPRVTYDTRKATVWNSPVVLLIFLGCVSAEWIIRRRNHLV